MTYCSTLKQELARAEASRKGAYLKAAVKDTLLELTGYEWCPVGPLSKESTFSLTFSTLTSWRGVPEWVLSGPRPDQQPLAEWVYDSLVALFPQDALHFWLMPHYDELQHRITFFPQPGKHDPFALYEMCQPFYWEGDFTGTMDKWRRDHSMTLHAAYTCPLNAAAQLELPALGVEVPIAVVILVNIEMSAYRFPGLSLDKKIASPAGKSIYGYKAELRGWNAQRYHGGYSPYGPYPDSRQLFWNAC
jgi:hypothetical protein